MLKKNKIVIIFLIIILTSIVSINTYEKISEKRMLEKLSTKCLKDYSEVSIKDNKEDSILMIEYAKNYNKLFPYFLINTAIINNKHLDFIRIMDTQYILPKQILSKSDATIGYGIQGSIPEDSISGLYNINSYGYDCGYSNVFVKNKKSHFIKECIATYKHVHPISIKRMHHFGQNIQKLGLKNKKVFVRMAISGSEIDVMDEVLKNPENITGIAVVININKICKIEPTIKMLKNIEKHFILVNRNNDDYNGIYIKCPRGSKYSPRIALVYINKNLVDNYTIAKNQNSNSIKWEGDQTPIQPTDIVMWKMLPTIISKNHDKIFNFDIPRITNKLRKEWLLKWI